MTPRFTPSLLVMVAFAGCNVTTEGPPVETRKMPAPNSACGPDISLQSHDASSMEWACGRVQGNGPVEAHTFSIPIDGAEAWDFDALDSPHTQRCPWDFWICVSASIGLGVPTAGNWTAPYVFEGTLAATAAAMVTPPDP